MINKDRCNRLIQEGFSLITVRDNKLPNIKWKESMTTPLTINEFSKVYDLETTEGIGIVTGYDFLECIDVDLKVFSTAKEQIDFWDELLELISTNIINFDEKFVVKKTKNAGYHILYKSKRVQGNTKLSKLKGHKEAVIETRGIGGYVFVYEKSIGNRNYKDIEFISDEDREILISCCKSYNFIDETNKIEIPKKEIKEYDNTGITVWDDYNTKHSVFDVIGDEFEVVTNVSDKFIIRRFNATSPHSGYVYHDSGCMYLFSTGTNYPNEKLISPFAAIIYKDYNGDFSKGTKDLYTKGYGDRIKVKSTFDKVEMDINYSDLSFPIEVFPLDLQKYIVSCNETLSSSIDYLGCSLLWMTSIMVGNSINIEVKKGWKETANLWIALIGKAGIGKTPSINNITFPLTNKNSREIKEYIKKYEKFEAFLELDKKDQDLTEQIKKPKKTQFIVNDITLEALVDLHGENKNGIGVLKDELAGWFKDMNKYRQGSDLEHWLSSWSGKEINMNRKTAKSSFVDKAFIPVLGGIQPAIMDAFYTEENKDSGFIDRMLFSYPELEVDMYSENEMKEEYLTWYEDYILSMQGELKKLTQYNDDGDIEPVTAYFSAEAKTEWIRVFNEITLRQKSDEENEYMKSMLPKQKSYIPRFALLLNILNSFNEEGCPINEISKDSVLKAEKLSNYFVAMSKKIKSNSIESSNIKKVIEKSEGKNNYDKFVKVYEIDKKLSKSKIADTLGLSRQQVYNYIKTYEKK
jgi:hypothetical protein